MTPETKLELLAKFIENAKSNMSYEKDSFAYARNAGILEALVSDIEAFIIKD